MHSVLIIISGVICDNQSWSNQYFVVQCTVCNPFKKVIGRIKKKNYVFFFLNARLWIVLLRYLYKIVKSNDFITILFYY